MWIIGKKNCLVTKSRFKKRAKNTETKVFAQVYLELASRFYRSNEYIFTSGKNINHQIHRGR
jgi:hypothetical protein